MKKREPTTLHTPGPWLARDYPTKEGDVWIDCNSWKNPKTASVRGGTLATVLRAGAGNGAVDENARLIALAPFAPHDCADVECAGHRLLALLKTIAGDEPGIFRAEARSILAEMGVE